MSVRWIVVALVLVGTWVLDRRLFAVCAGAVAAWGLYAWGTRRHDESSAGEAGGGPRLAPVPLGDTLPFDVYEERTRGDHEAATTSLLVAMGLDVALVIIVRRRRPGAARLVQNTPIDTARFEYELHGVEVPPDLADDWEAASNSPADLAGFLFDPVVRSVLASTGPRFESLRFDGCDLWVDVSIPSAGTVGLVAQPTPALQLASRRAVALAVRLHAVILTHDSERVLH